MKQVILNQHGGPEALCLTEFPDLRPAFGQVVIQARAIAVSRPDILMRQGRYAWSPSLPFNPGNELTGNVISVGDGVRHIQVGDVVLVSARELPQRGGCYAEQVAVPAAAVHVLPFSVSLEHAVTLPSYVVAHAMLKCLGVTHNARSIFINGVSGSVGSALAELAKTQNLQVIGTVGDANKAKHAASRGVDHVLNYNVDNVLESVRDITNGRGVDVVFDHVIGPRFPDCIKMLAKFGTAVAYNVYSQMPDQDIFALMRHLSPLSLGLRIFNIHSFDDNLPLLHKLTEELVDLLSRGQICPLIGARFPLSEVAEAHRAFEGGHILGKILLVP